MKYYKLIKCISRIILFFEIIFSISLAVFSFAQHNVIGLILAAVFVFAVILPQYVVVFFLERHEIAVNRNFDNVAYKLSKMEQGIFNEKDNNFQNISEVEIIPMFTNCLSKLEKMMFESKENSRLLNEILISAAVNREIDNFLGEIIPKVMDVTKSNCCVFYMTNKTTNKLEIKSSIGFGKSIYSQFDISLGEGLVGQAAVENKIKVVDNVDDDSIFITKTFMGDMRPKNVIVIPVCALDDENEVLGVLAAGSIYKYDNRSFEIFGEIRKYISYAVINGTYYNKMQRLTNELKFQNQLIQNLNEDLELKIKERTLFLNNIINSINGYSIISVDTTRMVTLFNDGAVERFGVMREDVIDNPISEIQGIDEYIMNDGVDYIDTAFRNGKSSHISTIKTEYGEALLEVEMFDMNNEFDEVSGITIVIRDISYIKKLKVSADLEKKMTDIMLEESSKAIVIIREDSCIEGISKNAEYILGVTTGAASGKRLWEFFENQDEVYGFVESIFFDEPNKSIDVIAANTSINISMRAKILFDDNEGIKKALIYL